MAETREYRVVSGTVHVREGDGDRLGDLVGYGPGEVVELRPEQAEQFEVESVGDESGESAAQSEAPAETTDGSDSAEVTTQGVESDESDERAAPPDELTDEWIQSAGYEDLRAAAAEYDDMNGNWGADRLRAELSEKTT